MKSKGGRLYKKKILFIVLVVSLNNYSLFPNLLHAKINNKMILGSATAFVFMLIVFYYFYKNNQQKEKKSTTLLIEEESISIELDSILRTIKTIDKKDLEKGFKIFLQLLFDSGIPRNPHDKQTFPVIDLISTSLKNALSQNEYIKLILFIIEKNYDCHNCILDWTIKTNLAIFFKIIDEEGNTVLHHILSKKPLSYHFLPVLQYLLKRINKTGRTLLDTKNNNGETILFSLLQNEHLKHMSGYEWQYVNCLVGSGIDVNARNNKKQHIFDLVLHVPTLDQIELFWNFFNMPHYYDIPKYSPQDLSVKNYFKMVRENIPIAADILKSFFSYFVKLHDYAQKVVKKDKGWCKNNSREPYIKSFWILSQTCEIIKSTTSFKYIDWMFLESKERWLRKKEKMKKNLGSEEKIVDLDSEGLNYDVIRKIYRTEEEQKPYMRLENVPGKEDEMDWKEYKPDPFYYNKTGYRWTKEPRYKKILSF